MREITVLSGKGGTGKTTISASLVLLADKCTAVDCDVGASNMHLLLDPQHETYEEISLGKLAVRNYELCISCGKCTKNCRFQAAGHPIDTMLCEGCGVCAYVCPAEAIQLSDHVGGAWMRSRISSGALFHAHLEPGGENSGKLVSLLRTEARSYSKHHTIDTMICDGSPGIGCPVIASLSGASEVLLVTEPTVSAMHDLERIIELIRYFRIPGHVCVNRWDMHPEMTEKIEKSCLQAGIHPAGRIRTDNIFLKAQRAGKPPIEFDTPGAEDIRNLGNALGIRRNTT